MNLGDKSLDAVSTINMIGCLTAQMRAMDISLNTTYNPSKKPYIAVVDSNPCGGEEVMTWAIQSTGPAELGDGNYKSTAKFNGFGGVMSIEFQNIIVNSAVKKSVVSWHMKGQSAFKGTVIVDYSDSSKTDVIFSQDSGAYLHAIFNSTTYVGSVVSADQSAQYSLDFNAAAVQHLPSHRMY